MYQPGITSGWIQVLLHPIRYRRWLVGAGMSGFCWLVGHDPEEHPCADMVGGNYVVSCKTCGIQIMAAPMKTAEDQPLRVPGSNPKSQ